MERTFDDFESALEALKAAEKLELYYTLEKSTKKERNAFGYEREYIVFNLKIGEDYEG